MKRACILAGLTLLAACASPPENRLAAYRAPEIPPVCRDAVYNDSEVRALMTAGAAVPIYRAQHQDKLAFAQDEALRKCMREKSLAPPGGVEPVRYLWYKPLF